MSPVRMLGSALSVISGLWTAYIALVALTATYNCPVHGCPASLFAFVPYAQVQAVAGGALAVVAVVSLARPRPAFLAGAALSAVALVALALAWGTYTSQDAYVAAALSILSLVVDAVASRPSRALSERDSPLNLPVFG